ncbi:hypothetical protein LCGC14_0771060 [marine sediment metagenome]|uniref:Disease resistance R13L4/SHOC-2-like LRR domain-containing protein n=1 Tax=marine sediment metagenome TaxID=412755 RepID=A0A0F9QI24_9ZZZZ
MDGKEKEKSFKINEYLTVKLEGGQTVIYIADRPIRKCKFLLINIPVDEFRSFDEIQSIDEVAENLDRSLEPLRERKQFKYSIPPDVEFWGHSSNLQVWYENGYNTKLLHSNLAFPLLRELTRAGDTQARKNFKEEIAKRYNNGGENLQKFLRSEHYLDHLSIEEFLGLIDNENDFEVIAQLRELYPRFEKKDIGGMVLKLNIDIKKGRVSRLSLSGLEFDRIPECVRELSSLEHLSVSFDCLKSLPEWIGEFKELKTLKIGNNLLKTVPQEIGGLSKLEELYARGNQLEILPESIGNLKSLRILELYENRLKIIPDTISKLVNLELLDLHENSITVLPDTIGNLKNLKDLRLDKNQLHILPPEMAELRKLQKLTLSNNELKSIPELIGGLVNLELLDVSDNPLYRINKAIYNLYKLKDVWLLNVPLREHHVEDLKFEGQLLRIHYQKIKK